MKYAIVSSGGKQYMAREGEYIEVDRLPLDVGKPVEFTEVLLTVDGSSIKIGNPLVKGASVKGKVLDQVKAKKIIVFKYIPKERYRRKKGHRQQYTRVSIDKITLPAVKKKEAGAVEAEKAKKAPAKTAAKKAAPKAEKAPAKTAAKKAAPKAEKAPAKTAAKKAAPKDKKSTTKTSAKKASTKKTDASTKKKASKAESKSKKTGTKTSSAKKPTTKK